MQKLPGPLAQKLWTHQKQAIDFAFKRLRGSSQSSVSLVRLPTGTGKTGVMATLAIVFPPNGWTLVLTPWANLSDQLITDLRERFWLISDWRPSPAPKVERLLPSTAHLLVNRRDDKLILVATFATLVSLFNTRNNHPSLIVPV